MSTRPFAYNPARSTIVGTTNLVDLAIGTSAQEYAANPGGLTWWMGPEESSRYVICAPVASLNQPTPVGQTGSVKFWKSSTLSDSSFLELANYVKRKSGGSPDLTNATDAKTWLNANGYWTSWQFAYSAGLYKTTYAGYFNDNPTFFATATPTTYRNNLATSVQTTSIFEPATDDGTNFSCQWLGYFKPTTTETYTFYTSSDDASYVWVDINAQSGFTTANATVNNGGPHGAIERSGSITLTAGIYYPIRIQVGEIGGGDSLTFSYSTPTIAKTTNVTGLVFYNPVTNNF